MATKIDREYYANREGFDALVNDMTKRELVNALAYVYDMDATNAVNAAEFGILGS